MILPFIVRFVLKPFAPAVAVASLTSLAFVHSVSPAAAKMTECQVKHSFCSERCIMRNKTEGQGDACIARTCDHQFRACARESGETSGPEGGFNPRGGSRPGISHGDVRPNPPSRPGSPLGGGILTGGGGGLPHQGPASTGSPVMAPSAPAAPVILR
jgi:hypothetical protein